MFEVHVIGVCVPDSTEVVPHSCQSLWSVEEFHSCSVSVAVRFQMTYRVSVVVVLVVRHGCHFLWRLEEFDCFVVVVGMIGNCVVVVVEVAGHFVVADPMTDRVALVPVEVPPVWSLAVASMLMPLVHRRPMMMRKLMTMKKRGGDSLTQA